MAHSVSGLAATLNKTIFIVVPTFLIPGENQLHGFQLSVRNSINNKTKEISTAGITVNNGLHIVPIDPPERVTAIIIIDEYRTY